MEKTLSVNPRVTIPEVTTFIGAWDQTEKEEPFKSFRGIQYGKVEARFKASSMFDNYDRDQNAHKEGYTCPQLPFHEDFMSEDCLYLNIYTPRVVSKTAVMVWIHGGAFERGSGGQALFGPQYILDYDVILVTINYRVGPFGFLSLEDAILPGNIGLKDQNLALQWIKNNIGHFGGNAEDITIFGESAGSFSVMYQVVSPLSSGLFTKAIAQSGAPFSTFIHSSDHGKQRSLALSLANSLNCSTGNDYEVLACLEEKSIETILNAQYYCVDGSICTTNPWDAVVDYYSETPFLPNLPDRLVDIGEYAKIPMIIGVTSEEGIYSAADYIKDESKYSQINEDWDYYGPLFIFDTSDATFAQQAQADIIREFYLQDRNASLETIHDVIDFFSDTVFWVGPHR